jgi:hypothetical protein
MSQESASPSALAPPCAPALPHCCRVRFIQRGSAAASAANPAHLEHGGHFGRRHANRGLILWGGDDRCGATSGTVTRLRRRPGGPRPGRRLARAGRAQAAKASVRTNAADRSDARTALPGTGEMDSAPRHGPNVGWLRCPECQLCHESQIGNLLLRCDLRPSRSVRAAASAVNCPESGPTRRSDARTPHGVAASG